MNGFINASSITSPELLRGIDELIESSIEFGMIIRIDDDLDTNKRQIGVVDAPEVIVAVKLSRIEIQIKMVMGKLEAADAQYDGLQEAVDADLGECTTTVLLKRKQPESVQSTRLGLVERQAPEFYGMQSAEAFVAALDVIGERLSGALIRCR